ncbi:MAG: hypothetical protein EOO77_03860 [Oxalobacteraceae bacterium]|nr:MAG: hypothetical protein EOO77_03860 [Oxalobacteraceae bacterium]
MQENDTMRFRLMQDGMQVAACEGPAFRAAQEAAHYLAVYSQDGPCTLQYYTAGKRWRDVREGELENALAFRAENRMASLDAMLERDRWHDISTAPKDGTVILLTAFEDDGEQFETHAMRWAHIQRNGLFPGVVGMWTHPSGFYTWQDDGQGNGPTHWRAATESSDEQR